MAPGSSGGQTFDGQSGHASSTASAGLAAAAFAQEGTSSIYQGGRTTAAASAAAQHAGTASSGGQPFDVGDNCVRNEVVQELQREVKRLASVTEVLAGTVSQLTETVGQLEGRLENLEFEWNLWSSVQADDHHSAADTKQPAEPAAQGQPEHYMIYGGNQITPRDQMEGAEDDDGYIGWHTAQESRTPGFGIRSVDDRTTVAGDHDRHELHANCGEMQLNTLAAQQQLLPQPTAGPSVRSPLQAGNLVGLSIPGAERELGQVVESPPRDRQLGLPELCAQAGAPGPMQSGARGSINLHGMNSQGIINQQGRNIPGAGVGCGGVDAIGWDMSPHVTEVRVNPETQSGNSVVPQLLYSSGAQATRAGHISSQHCGQRRVLISCRFAARTARRLGDD